MIQPNQPNDKRKRNRRLQIYLIINEQMKMNKMTRVRVSERKKGGKERWMQWIPPIACCWCVCVYIYLIIIAAVTA